MVFFFQDTSRQSRWTLQTEAARQNCRWRLKACPAVRRREWRRDGRDITLTPLNRHSVTELGSVEPQFSHLFLKVQWCCDDQRENVLNIDQHRCVCIISKEINTLCVVFSTLDLLFCFTSECVLSFNRWKWTEKQTLICVYLLYTSSKAVWCVDVYTWVPGLLNGSDAVSDLLQGGIWTLNTRLRKMIWTLIIYHEVFQH